MTTEIIGGAAAARIGRLIGLGADASTAEFSYNDDFSWIMRAYASDRSIEVTVKNVDDDGFVIADFVRIFPLLKKQVTQSVCGKNPVLCSWKDWDPDVDLMFPKDGFAEPFMPANCGDRLRQAYNEFKAELAREAAELDALK